MGQTKKQRDTRVRVKFSLDSSSRSTAEKLKKKEFERSVNRDSKMVLNLRNNREPS